MTHATQPIPLSTALIRWLGTVAVAALMVFGAPALAQDDASVFLAPQEVAETTGTPAPGGLVETGQAIVADVRALVATLGPVREGRASCLAQAVERAGVPLNTQQRAPCELTYLDAMIGHYEDTQQTFGAGATALWAQVELLQTELDARNTQRRAAEEAIAEAERVERDAAQAMRALVQEIDQPDTHAEQSSLEEIAQNILLARMDAEAAEQRRLAALRAAAQIETARGQLDDLAWQMQGIARDQTVHIRQAEYDIESINAGVDYAALGGSTGLPSDLQGLAGLAETLRELGTLAPQERLTEEDVPSGGAMPSVTLRNPAGLQAIIAEVLGANDTPESSAN
jgi:hypothetical protein